MCGIAGFIDFNKRLDKETLIDMTDILHHRGPDDSGYSFESFSHVNIGLGHRRLSILDLSSHGHQPMSLMRLRLYIMEKYITLVKSNQNSKLLDIVLIHTLIQKCYSKLTTSGD